MLWILAIIATGVVFIACAGWLLRRLLLRIVTGW